MHSWKRDGSNGARGRMSHDYLAGLWLRDAFFCCTAIPRSQMPYERKTSITLDGNEAISPPIVGCVDNQKLERAS